MEPEGFPCRPGCGACCVAPSINLPFYGMPEGKGPGIRCVHLTDDARCALFGDPRRPIACSGLRPHPEMCGNSREDALGYLRKLEALTKPDRG